MGWNWVTNIANHCNVFVITEGEWKDEILEAVEKLPQKDNIHFYFNPLPDKVRKMCWNQGDWRFYWYYAKWQKKTLEIARDVISKNHIDVMHQLNMIGFRELGYLWKIKDIPLVWGPVGGIANIPPSYLKGAGWKMNLFCRLKNFISDMQFRFHPRVRAAVKHSKMIAAMKEVQTATRKIYGKELPLINETGSSSSPKNIKILNKSSDGRQNDNILTLLWVGKFDYLKRLDLALRTVAATNNTNIRLCVCGTGTASQIKKYKTLGEELGIENQIQWLGKVPHAQMPNIMNKSDILFFTSISDATSTVVVEAISADLPILSFNICGFGQIVRDFAGKTIELSNPDQSVKEFAQQLNLLYQDRDKLKVISKREVENVYSLSWQSKGEKMYQIYKSLVELQ